MNTPKAQKLIKKILDDLDHAGIITNTIVKDLKDLRPYAVEEKKPVLAKAIRLTYEHVEANDTFNIPIPEDEPFEDEEGNPVKETSETEAFSPEESLTYLISLMKDCENKLNIQELREYNEALIEYEETH